MALEKRISELTAKTGAIEDTDLMVISDYNGTTYDTKKVTGAQIKPFKTYLVSVSQIGTSAPTVNYSYSELTSTVSFARTSTGLYALNLSTSEFTVNKTFVQITNGETGAGVILGAYRASATQIAFYSTDSITQNVFDSGLDNAQIEIKIIK
jgi:hypothetical protein